MKTVKIIGLLLCLIYICINCTKEEEEVEAEIPFIIGDTSDNFTLVTFDPAIGIGYLNSLDLDGDGNSDFEYISLWWRACQYCYPISIETLEILNPDIEYSAHIDPDSRSYPKKYNEGDTIYFSDQYICWTSRKINLDYWKYNYFSNNYLKYILFRLSINESYLYGWFQISVYNYSIRLHGYAIQKKEPLNY